MDLPSLDGLTVGVTADGRAHEELELLTGCGATVLHGPTVCTATNSHDDGLRAVTLALVEQPADFVVANTGLGMRAWWSAADVWRIGEALRGAVAQSRIVARSDRAAAAMRQAGFPVERELAASSGRRLVEELRALGMSGRRVAWELPGPLEEGYPRELAEVDAVVAGIPVSEWSLPLDIGPARRLVEAVIAGRVDAMTFTSAPAVRNLLLVAEEHGRPEALLAALNGRVVAMCVGPVCAATARRCGIVAPEMPPTYRLVPMVRRLATLLASTTRTFRFGDHQLVFRGSVIEVDADRIELEEREAAVLRALLVRPGVAMSRREILEAVWGDRTRDGYVVEAAVGRLRRRLGECADLVVAVPRRGYRFDGQFAA